MSNIRPYAPGDLAPIAEVFHESVHHVASADYTVAQCNAWAPAEYDSRAWAARLGSGQTRVAERDGALAGFAVLAHEGHVDMLFVRPGHLRRGVASALLAWCEAAARHAGCQRLERLVLADGQRVDLKTGATV